MVIVAKDYFTRLFFTLGYIILNLHNCFSILQNPAEPYKNLKPYTNTNLSDGAPY